MIDGELKEDAYGEIIQVLVRAGTVHLFAEMLTDNELTFVTQLILKAYARAPNRWEMTSNTLIDILYIGQIP